MEYVQEIALLQCIFRIGIRVHFVPSGFNWFADALSREKLDAFHKYAELFSCEFDEMPIETPKIEGAKDYSAESNQLNVIEVK